MVRPAISRERRWPTAKPIGSGFGTLDISRTSYRVSLLEGNRTDFCSWTFECHCKWVLRADADDRSVPKRAELQLNHLAENPHLAVLGGQLSENSSQKGTVNIRRVPQRPEQVKRMMNWRNPINHPTVALNRQKVILAGNYRASLSFEDWDLWLRLMNKGADLANLQDILVIAEVDSNHLARRHGIKYANHEFRFLLRCQRENMMTVWQTIVLVLMRIPWRLLPKFWLVSVMNILRLQTKSRF